MAIYARKMKAAYLALILVVGSLRANEDLPLPWHSLTVGFGDTKSDDSVRVTTRGDRLSEISVCWHGKTFAVPASEFGSAPKPQIKTFDVLQGQFSRDNNRGVPYLIVEMRYGTASFGEYPTAQFLFYSERYQRVTFRTRIGENQWQHSEKLPGKEATIEGTETSLGTVKKAEPTERK